MAFFVTGTDTGVGKTRATLGLLAAIQQQGWSACGMKPVASGSDYQEGHLRNADALKIQAQSEKSPPYDLVNPYAFVAPTAPIIAAEEEHRSISIKTIVQAYDQLSQNVDYLIVEGIGGWRMPLNEHEQLSDLVKTLKLGVIMVVGLRLGCINHALLTADAIIEEGVELSGWVANCLDPAYDRVEQTLDLLAQNLRAPLLGVLPYNITLDLSEIVSHLNLKQLRLGLDIKSNVS